MKKLQYHCHILIYLVLALFLISCAPFFFFSSTKTSVEPPSLPNAKLGQPYYATITINSYPGPVIPRLFRYEITPTNSGLDLKVLDTEAVHPYNDFKLEGVPIVTGEIILRIHGGTFGTMEIGQDFDKTYTIKVEDADER
ncbi:hypothetical protein [Gilliamella sp. wkB108]|uniref:hypothetical protein n=1 Tax=Gilliamella sp. wkB108 TaxID=3120256 RepID=UPI0009BED5D8|nr:hypothetical protein [Gilliamella apicola]